MEFDPFSLSVKYLTTRSVLDRYDSTGPLYTLPLPTPTTPTMCDLPYALAATASSTTGIVALVTSDLMSSPSCQIGQPLPSLGTDIIPCVIPANLVGMSGCPFLSPLLGSFDHLTLYTVTSRTPLF
jgi:hypothetical protein